MAPTGNGRRVTVPFEEVTANYVPAAAVIRRWQALSGIIGRKERAGGNTGLELKAVAQLLFASETV